MISYVLSGAAAMLIGMASGQVIVLSAGRSRLAYKVNAMGSQVSVLIDEISKLQQSTATMITRAEVENAFAQVAQIEAQRQNAAMQQARAREVFGKGGAPADLNKAINAQLDSLSERINRINQEFGVG